MGGGHSPVTQIDQRRFHKSMPKFGLLNIKLKTEKRATGMGERERRREGEEVGRGEKEGMKGVWGVEGEGEGEGEVM